MKFIKGALYIHTDTPTALLRYDHVEEDTKGFYFLHVSGKHNFCLWRGFVGFPNDTVKLRRAYHWSDLLTPADRAKAARLIDPLNGKFEDEILRHLAAKRAKRAKRRNMQPLLGGEYYCKN